MINNATEREKNQFGDKFVEKLIRRIALIHNYFQSVLKTVFFTRKFLKFPMKSLTYSLNI